MNLRLPLEITASIAMSLAVAAIPTVPFVLTAQRTFEIAEGSLPGDFASEDEGEPEDDDWMPLPAPPQRVVVVSRAVAAESPPSESPVVAPPPESPPLPPQIVSVVPPVEGGVGVAIADPLAFLENGWGQEPAEGEVVEDDGVPEAGDLGMDDDGFADAAEPTAKRGRAVSRTRPARARVGKSSKPPCVDDNPGITEIEPGAWAVNRSLVEYYATHLLEFEQLATYTVVHKDDQGVPDGFKVGMKRCGVLWEGGLRSGDVISSVNGRTITSVMQAVGAYFALRNERQFEVALTRKSGETLVLRYELLDDSREDRAKMREFLKQARAAHQEVRRQEREEKRAERAEKRATPRGR